MEWGSLPTEIISRLKATSGVTSKVADRVHYQIIPQSSDYPHVWVTRSGVESEDLLEGDGVYTERYTVEVVGNAFDADLIDSIVTTLKNLDGPVGGGTVFVTEVEDADDDYLFKSADADAVFLHALRVSVFHDGSI